MKIRLLSLLGIALAFLNSAKAQVAAPAWQQTTAPNQTWRSIASSADGTRLVAIGDQSNPVNISTNSGATWTPSSLTVAANFFASHSVASSADGKILAAIGNGAVYVSVDFGATWTSRLTESGVYHLVGIAMSASGTKMVAAEQSQSPSDNSGEIYTSSDSGTNWTLRFTGGTLADIASSADGTKLIAAGGSFLNGLAGPVYFSINSGTNWTNTTSEIMSNLWSSVTCSADGTKVFATEDSLSAPLNGDQYFVGRIHISTNSGANWDVPGGGFAVSPAEDWMSIACSTNGNVVVAVAAIQPYFAYATSGMIFTSTNAGTSWQLAYAPNVNWRSAAVSADGTKFYAADRGGTIYFYNTPATNAPTMNIASGGGNAFVSWPWPSTGFVLQQTTNLVSSNWVTLSNVTAVVSQAIVPQTNANNFYRLVQP
jgi:hypothetical protein